MQICTQCGSNARFRGLILGVMRYVLKDDTVPLLEQAEQPGISALGISDSETYAKHLAAKISYTNTFYHIDPSIHDSTFAIPRRSLVSGQSHHIARNAAAV